MRRILAAVDPAPSIAPEVMDWLRAWHWPGNLRELRNVLEYAAAICSSGYIQLAELLDALLVAAARAAQDDAPTPLMLPTEAQLQLRAPPWNVTAVAKQLRAARMTLYRHMKRWGITAESSRRVTGRHKFVGPVCDSLPGIA